MSIRELKVAVSNSDMEEEAKAEIIEIRDDLNDDEGISESFNSELAISEEELMFEI